MVDMDSIKAPVNSAKRNQEMPVNRLTPAANITINSSVPPVKPRYCADSLPISWPSIPPGASGKGVFKLQKRRASIPVLVTSSTANPAVAIKNGRRSA